MKRRVTRKAVVSAGGWLGLTSELVLSYVNHVPPEPTLTLVFAAAAGIPIAKFFDGSSQNPPYEQVDEAKDKHDPPALR